MAKNHFLPRATSQVVEHYIDTRLSPALPISTSHAVRAIRTVLPACGLTDRELTDMIAAAAIRKGRDVAFDASP